MTREWKLLCEANGYCFLTGKIENKFCVCYSIKEYALLQKGILKIAFYERRPNIGRHIL